MLVATKMDLTFRMWVELTLVDFYSQSFYHTMGTTSSEVPFTTLE